MKNDEPKGFFSEFKKNFDEGYAEQDQKIKKDKEKNSDAERIVEGLATGTTESVLNPFRWLGLIFK